MSASFKEVISWEKRKNNMIKFWYHKSFFHYLWNKNMKLYEVGLCFGPRFLFIVIEQIERENEP
jgi:hypothetical protein